MVYTVVKRILPQPFTHLSTQLPETPATDSRRVIAERNLQAILDAAERLLQRGEQPSISAVASEAGVSRPTVYAHFPDRRELLRGLVERTVQRAMSAIEAAEPDRGPAPDALQRLIASSWQQIAGHDEIARAAAHELSAEAMRQAHESARGVIGKLIERGRRDGSFRTDVPADWLVTASLALVHAAAEEVRTGQLDAETAPNTLSLTISDLLRRSENPSAVSAV
jgi:TetR/AcrR family transcriptional repressor of mexCD-oprJ operon